MQHKIKPTGISLDLKKPVRMDAQILLADGKPVDNADQQDQGFPCRLVTADVVLWSVNGPILIPHDELKAACESFVAPQPFDRNHDQDVNEIIGEMDSVEYLSEGGENFARAGVLLYTSKSEDIRLNYYAIQRGTLKFVSSELKYGEGECSICSKRFTAANWQEEMCIHQRKFIGATLNGKLCYTIVHQLRLGGGALVRDPADKTAQIQAACAAADYRFNNDNEIELALAGSIDEGGAMKTQGNTPEDKTKVQAASGDNVAAPEDGSVDTQTADNTDGDDTQTKVGDVQAGADGDDNASDNAADGDADDATTDDSNADDGNADDDKADDDKADDAKPKGEGLSPEQLTQMVQNLTDQLEVAQKERDAEKSRANGLEQVVWQVKWQLRKFEAKVLIEEMKRQGVVFDSEDDERQKYWELCDMPDPQFAGFKASYLLSSSSHNRTLLLAENLPTKEGEVAKPKGDNATMTAQASAGAPAQKPAQQTPTQPQPSLTEMMQAAFSTNTDQNKSNGNVPGTANLSAPVDVPDEIGSGASDLKAKLAKALGQDLNNK